MLLMARAIAASALVAATARVMSRRLVAARRARRPARVRTSRAIFEGGQTRFATRMPYLGGFKNPFRKEYIVINMRDLSVFDTGAEVEPRDTCRAGVDPRRRRPRVCSKILGEGKLDRALKVTAHKVSASARAQIEKAGGSVTLIELKRPEQTKRSGRPAPDYKK